MISLAVLFGGDYTNGVHGFGPAAAIFVSAGMEAGGLSAPQEHINLGSWVPEAEVKSKEEMASYLVRIIFGSWVLVTCNKKYKHESAVEVNYK
ncbi:hypothetical protein ACP4OV_017656 [Aristida adscensionis]